MGLNTSIYYSAILTYYSDGFGYNFICTVILMIIISYQNIFFVYFYSNFKCNPMSNPYQLSVNNGKPFDASESDLEKLDAIPATDSKFHILKDSKSYKAEVVSTDFIAKKYTVKVNNNTYEVAISDALDLLIQSMGIERGGSKVINAIKAPMPGLILEISVKAGQEVKENDPLLILEAMKMENSFLSPRNGIIKSIAVEKGNAVDKGQLLIEFE